VFLTMLSCPRCGTVNLKEGRSLSMHLTRYCMGPSLLFHAQRGTLAKKHSHELMLSGSCPSTYKQQIRNFNSLTVNVSVPTINTLHGMPSLSHSSSTQSELGNCNVHYLGFDTDLFTLASVDDQINTNDDSGTNPVIEKCSFHRNTICLPPDIAFQVHLLSQMNTHRGNDLNSLTAIRFWWEQKLLPCSTTTVGIGQKAPSTTNTTIHKHHHHGRAVRPSYGVGSMDPLNPMQVTSSKGVGQGRSRGVLYELIN
jgi:hypothetical protein